MRITPENIETLNLNEIFVFGSNLAGIHGAGAARLALDKFGAIFGIGIGLQGQSYAIPTKDQKIKTLPLFVIKNHISYFITFAANMPSMKFLVTKIGCGLAGLKPSEIAPFFKTARYEDNIYLPQDFWNEIEKGV